MGLRETPGLLWYYVSNVRNVRIVWIAFHWMINQYIYTRVTNPKEKQLHRKKH